MVIPDGSLIPLPVMEQSSNVPLVVTEHKSTPGVVPLVIVMYAYSPLMAIAHGSLDPGEYASEQDQQESCMQKSWPSSGERELDSMGCC